MKEITSRYAKITKKFPREFILLQGTGCFWKKCKFCDYFEDVSENPFSVNKPVIEKLTGEFGIVEIINSGSAMELDPQTLDLIAQKADEINIREIWFEVHWAYRNKLDEFAKKFKNQEVKFRTGIETFNSKLRNSWNKGIHENIAASEIAKYFSSVNLLVGVKGQTLEDIKNDIEIAEKFFERYMVNVFVENDSQMKPDFDLINRFLSEIYPTIKDKNNVEISINNTDLGVG
ncbi:MAG: radical SAM protein [Clostridia bacterium]|nr:radical SAM protein [Clostridia bacterium]